jgi:diguanylate cyclase (GGDEF)-like protein
MNQKTRAPEHWIVRLNHKNRTGSFVFLFAIIGTHMAGMDYGLLAWSLLALQFLVYPQLVYWRARRASDSRQAELNNLVLDSLLFGAWAAALLFPLWITYTLFISTTINHAIFRSTRGIFLSLSAIVCGILLAVASIGWHLAPQTDWPVTLLCIVGLSLYLLIVANESYARNRQLSATRKKLHQGEQTLHAANQALQHQLDEIHVLQAQLREQAHRDPLTGLYNRRYLDATLARELARSAREAQPLSLMLIDIDHFKQVNDRYGHQAGDEVLKQLAALLNEQARSTDVVCRFGGEEFLLLLPNMPQDMALERAEHWRANFAALTVPCGLVQVQATLSIGIASYPEHGTLPDELIHHADLALYRAKADGRNRVVLFTPPVA